MTQADYEQAQKAGKVQKDAPAETAPDTPTNEHQAYTFEDFLPMLVRMLQTGDTNSIVGRSRKTAGQSIPGQTLTQLVYETNDYAEGITWDSGNNRFEVVTAGKYLVSANTYWSSTAANFFFSTIIYVNGAEYSRGVSMSANTAGGIVTSSVCDTLNLSSGDNVSIEVYTSDTAAETVGTISKTNFFNIVGI